MEISAPTSPATTPAQTTTSASRITSDFDTFLKMLTTQMKNQDPLNPIDSSDYAVQLATFSGVEQQMQTNRMLGELSGKFGLMGMAQLAGWVGNEARSAGPVWFDGAPVSLAPVPMAGADRAVLVVQDARGTVVAREDIALGAEEISWGGTGITGATLPTGLYQLSLESYAKGELTGISNVESYARIQEVQGGTGTTTLILTGGVKVDAAAVTALRSGI